MSRRLEWLDLARGVSILLVVVFHASIILAEQGAIPEIYWLLNNVFSPVRMPVFFLISGILARNVIQASWHSVLRRRVALLAYLFTVWTVIHFCLNAIVSLGNDTSLLSLLMSFYSPSSTLWFIWALTFYVVVARAGLSTSQGAVMGISVLSSVVIHSGYITFDSYVYANVVKFMPFFLFGAWYSSSVIRSDVFRSRPYILTSVALYVVFFVALYEQLVPMSLNGPTRFLLEVMGVNVGICAAVLACRSAALAHVPLYLGRNTLAVYVAHYPIMQVLSPTFRLATDALWLEQFWVVPAMVTLAISLSLLLKVVADRLGARWLYTLPTSTRPPTRLADS